MNVKGIGKTHEKVEERTIVNRFSNLRVIPADVAQCLDLLIGDAIGVSRERFDEFEQQHVLWREAGSIEIPRTERGCGRRVLFALQLQEPGVAAQSIMATVER